MAVGLRLLNEGKGDAFVSAGNSGALCVGATLAIKRIKGIKRPAFAPVMPSESGFFMLMDGGANVECRPEMLYQFAVMGSIYMEKVMGIKNPVSDLPMSVQKNTREQNFTEIRMNFFRTAN